ncbi:MAG: type VI secretion system membrane subunit TssM [Gammaproteobacteria bacterium]
MTGLLALLRLPFLSSLAGAVIIIALLWTLGPLLSISGYNPLTSQRNRIIAAIIVIVLFALYMMIKSLLARRKNRKMAEDLAKTEKDSTQIQTEEEIATLNKLFDQALAELKKAKLGKGKGETLYQLPWYVIIGPPGSGKTTALINSGLNFPLAKRLGTNKIKGVGGTRNCDWWFTDHAVLLDTAGRYTTQDSHQSVDSAAWTKFLELLKKHRRQRPINGVMVAISLSDLMQKSETERAEEAQTIRRRIQELHEQLGIRFPIYVLFTKADLIAGCMEFFDDLSKEERAQVWGMTFPVDDLKTEGEPVVEHFLDEFQLLEERLNMRLLKRLQDERDSQRRDLIYIFPQQFSALKNLAKQFLDEVFQPNRFEERSLLRGVYFTSGTQEGNPIDRLMGSLAATFGIGRQLLPSFSGSGRSYFLNRLFLSVIFQESGLAGTNLRMLRRRRMLKASAYIAVVLVVLAAAGVWFNSYRYNQALVADINSRTAAINATAAEIKPEQREPVAVLDLLDQARAVPGATGELERAPIWLRLGLYQGDKMGTSAHTAYRNLLERALFSRLFLQAERRIQDLLQQADVGVELYDALKAYLMLDRSVQERPLEADFLSNWFAEQWRQDASLTEDQRVHLQVHLNALLETLPETAPLFPDTELIKKARDRLPQQLNAEQLYQQLRNADYGIAPFRISEVGGTDVSLVFTRLSGAPINEGVAGIFTRPGQLVFVARAQARIDELSQGDWVLDIPPLPIQQLQQQLVSVQERYWAEYCPQWENLMADLDLTAPSGALQDAIDKFYVLSSPNSPLRAIVQAVAEQVQSVPNCLETLGQLTQGDAPTALDKLLSELDEVAVLLAPLAKAKEDGRILDQEASNTALARLEQLPRNKPAPLNRWLLSLTEPIPIYLFEGIRAYMNSIWRRDVLSFCQRSFRNRYPLVSDSPDDISLRDFGRFFGAGGVLDAFINKGDQRFTAFVDTSKARWEWKTFDNNPGVPVEKLAMLQFGDQIKQAFFPTGGRQPAVRFQLQPVSIDPALSRVLLEMNGQSVSFSPGVSQASSLVWPNASEGGRVRVQFFPAAGGTPPITIEENGPWALFRLLDRVRLRVLADNLFSLSLRAGNFNAQLELRADNVPNPFRLRLEDFRCPQTL